MKFVSSKASKRSTAFDNLNMNFSEVYDYRGGTSGVESTLDNIPRCAVCEGGLRELGYFCIACGHGGHAEHLEMWFANNVECPTGCRCLCATIGFSEKTEFLHNFVYDFRALARGEE